VAGWAYKIRTAISGRIKILRSLGDVLCSDGQNWLGALGARKLGFGARRERQRDGGSDDCGRYPHGAPLVSAASGSPPFFGLSLSRSGSYLNRAPRRGEDPRDRPDISNQQWTRHEQVAGAGDIDRAIIRLERPLLDRVRLIDDQDLVDLVQRGE
jgi:hypothetical protein